MWDIVQLQVSPAVQGIYWPEQAFGHLSSHFLHMKITESTLNVWGNCKGLLQLKDHPSEKEKSQDAKSRLNLFCSGVIPVTSIWIIHASTDWGRWDTVPSPATFTLCQKGGHTQETVITPFSPEERGWGAHIDLNIDQDQDVFNGYQLGWSSNKLLIYRTPGSVVDLRNPQTRQGPAGFQCQVYSYSHEHTDGALQPALE